MADFDWGGLVRGLINTADYVSRIKLFREILNMSLSEGANVISAIVQNAKTWDEVDQLEKAFILFASTLYIPEERTRAMMLYAYLKVIETSVNNGQFRGFPDSNGG